MLDGIRIKYFSSSTLINFFPSKHLPVQRQDWSIFKVGIKDPKRRFVVIVNLEHIAHFFLVFLLLILNW